MKELGSSGENRLIHAGPKAGEVRIAHQCKLELDVVAVFVESPAVDGQALPILEGDSDVVVRKMLLGSFGGEMEMASSSEFKDFEGNSQREVGYMLGR
jgi:hypothetical protein